MELSFFRRIVLIFLLWLVGLVAAGQFTKISVPFEQFIQAYPNEGDGVAWLLTIISLFGAVFGMVAGVFVARFGAVRLLWLAMVFGGLISLWQSLLPSFSIMLLSRFLEGASHLVIVVAAPSLIVQIGGARLARWGMTLWSTFFGVCFVLTAGFAYLFFPKYGLGAFLAVHGVMMLSLMVVLMVMFRLWNVRSDRSGSPLHMRQAFSWHVEAYTSPAVSAPALGWLYYTLTFVSLITVLPTLVAPSVREFFVSAMPFIGIASALLIAPFFIRKYGSVPTIIIGFVISALMAFLTIFGFGIIWFSIAIYAGLGLVQAASFASVPELNSTVEAQARAYGALAQMGNLGNLLGAPLLFWILTRFGVEAMFLFVCLIYALGAVTHWILATKRALAA